MKQFLHIALLLIINCAQAESIRYDLLPETLKNDIRWGYSWGAKEAQTRVFDLPFRDPVEGYVRAGLHRDYGTPWNDKINHVAEMQEPAITLSFDLHDVSLNRAGSLITLYTADIYGHEGLHIHVNEDEEIAIYSRKFSNSTTPEHKSRIYLGPVEYLLDKTITMVYDGKSNTIRAYVNGEPAEQHIRLRHTNDKPAKQICGMQWGDSLRGGPSVDKAEFQNIYIWNRALSEEEVCLIVKGRLTPVQKRIIYIAASLLLALLGGYYLFRTARKKKNEVQQQTEFTPTFVNGDSEEEA